jgi:hypothetical protein
MHPTLQLRHLHDFGVAGGTPKDRIMWWGDDIGCRIGSRVKLRSRWSLLMKNQAKKKCRNIVSLNRVEEELILQTDILLAIGRRSITRWKNRGKYFPGFFEVLKIQLCSIFS